MYKILMGIVLFVSHAFACTGIVKKAEDGSVVYARTLEFGADLMSFDLAFVPRGTSFKSETGSTFDWKVKYAHVGFNPFGMPLIIADGINEKGLACGAFYFPGFAAYQNKTNHSVSNLDFVSWVLGNFATVDEVTEALKNTQVIAFVFKDWGIVPPLHYVVVDQKGEKAVIEYVKGELKTYSMPIEVITNSPPYDWHLLNVRNYIGLKALNDPSIKINGNDLSQFGQGSGALGLPGDFTPPSRLIRAAFFNQAVITAKNPMENIKRAFKILNQFDIPRGAVREKQADGKEIFEETQWTSASDLTGLKYYFHTYENRTIHFVDLNRFKDQTEPKTLSIKAPEEIVEVKL